MEILKHECYGNLEIMVKRVEYQQVQIISSEASTQTQTSVAWAKEADNSKTASYSSKNVTINTATGDINFGIAITRSTR